MTRSWKSLSTEERELLRAAVAKAAAAKGVEAVLALNALRGLRVRLSVG